MKRFWLFGFWMIWHFVVIGQRPYWQQETNYTIDVRLNDTDHSLDGFLKLDYINHSPDTLTFYFSGEPVRAIC